MFAPDDPRSKWLTAEAIEFGRQLVTDAPELSPEKRDRLRSLLHPPKRRNADAA